jgi:hypothetical protein
VARTATLVLDQPPSSARDELGSSRGEVLQQRRCEAHLRRAFEKEPSFELHTRLGKLGKAAHHWLSSS